MKRILSKKILRDFWDEYPDSEQYIKTWYEIVSKSNWKNPNEVKRSFIHASILKDSRIVFNVKGNTFRIIVKFNFEKQWAFIRFVGTHYEYDKIDANTI